MFEHAWFLDPFSESCSHRRVATGSKDNSIGVWDCRGVCVKVLSSHTGPVMVACRSRCFRELFRVFLTISLSEDLGVVFAYVVLSYVMIASHCRVCASDG